MNNLYAECGSTLLLKRQEQEQFERTLLGKKQEGIQGQWQQESPFKEVL